MTMGPVFVKLCRACAMGMNPFGSLKTHSEGLERYEHDGRKNVEFG